MFKDSAQRTTEIMRLCMSCKVVGAIHSLYTVRKSVFVTYTFFALTLTSKAQPL